MQRGDAGMWSGGVRRRRALTAMALVAAMVLAGCQLELGSAGNQLGAGPTAATGTFSAFINGPYSIKADGDPYSTHCQGNDATVTSCDSSGANADYGTQGQTYLVDVPSADVGTSITVSLYDPEFDSGSNAGDWNGASK